MATPFFASGVWETAVVTGTGAVTLTGLAKAGPYQNFSGAPSGSLVTYRIQDSRNNWEVGLGTYTVTTAPAATLTRNPTESSNGGAAVNFGGVICDITLEIISPVTTGGTSAAAGRFAALNQYGVFDSSFLSSPITPQPLAWSASITIPFVYSARLYSTANTNGFLNNPTSPLVGAEFTWDITQDSTGSRLLAFDSDFVFANGIVPILSTAAGATDTLSGYVRNDEKIIITALYAEAA